MGILAKYSLWLLGLLLLAAASFTSASLWFQRQSLTREAILRGESIALNLAAPAADALLTRNDLLLVGLSVSATQDNKGVVYAALLNDKGEVMGHADPKALMKPLDFSASEERLDLSSRAKVMEGFSGGVPLWDISVPVLLKGSNQVLGSAHIGLARAAVEDAIVRSMQALGGVSLVILLIGLGLSFAGLRVLVRPLRELSRASAAVGKGDLQIQVPVRSSDEVGRLAANFNSMISGLKEAEAAKLEQNRIESELALARSIQADLLPSQAPSLPGLEVAFSCVPAKELGGDFYDCIEIEKGALWGFLIADVSGKGVPAALHMANLRNLFRVFGPMHASPLETVKKVNAMAYPDLKSEAFVTMIYAVVDLRSRQLRMVNAGHDPAYCVSQGGIQAFESTALPIGLAEADEFDPVATELSFELRAGDLFFTYTDGVTEAMNGSGEQFTLQRLLDTLRGRSGAAASLAAVDAAVKRHAGATEQSDDVTMLAIRAS